MLDKKQIQVTFLFEFKMSHKAVEATYNISNSLDPGMAKYSAVVIQEVVQRRQEPWRRGGSQPAIRRWQQLRATIKADPPAATQEVAKELSVDHCIVVWQLKQTGKMKKLDKWVPHELTGNLKKKQIIVLKHHLILFCATRKNYFLIRIWWVVKIGFYTTIRDDQLSGLTEKQLQSTCQNQTCTKKGSWSLFGDLIHYSFLNPSDTITYEKYVQQTNEMHWKLQCLQPAFINRKGPITLYNSAWPHIA